MKHTQGTWEMDLDYSIPNHSKTQWIEIECNGKLLAEVKGQHHNVSDSEMHGNAKLMTAAPDMLNALMRLINEDFSENPDGKFNLIWETIQKATK